MKKLSALLFGVVLFSLLPIKGWGQEAYAWFNDNTLTFCYDNLRASREGGTYNLTEGDNEPAWCHFASINKVVFNPEFADARPTSTCAWFEGVRVSEIPTLSYLNTSAVTCMKRMFNNAMNFTTLDLSTFDTSNVTDMSFMFDNCYNLTSLDLSSFNTSKVTRMYSMFYQCRALKTLDLSNFDTSNVTNMSDMFFGCSKLTFLGLSGSFNTSKVSNMSEMFCACSKLTTLDLSNFDTSKATNMDHMFSNCTGLTTLDISNFNTPTVRKMGYMFNGCSSLTTIYVGDGWTTALVSSSEDMFNNCTNLVGGKGTTYDAEHVDADYAHIDGGPSDPGYFSEKVDGILGDVNSDGYVTIADVTALSDYLLGLDSTIDLSVADCNNDSNVSIADVTALIDYILNGQW